MQIVAPGTVVMIRGIRLIAVPISEINLPKSSELIKPRLDLLKNGFDKLEDILTNPNWQGDPITLTRSNGGKYHITDGRHRVSLANEKIKDGLKFVWARIQ